MRTDKTGIQHITSEKANTEPSEHGEVLKAKFEQIEEARLGDDKDYYFSLLIDGGAMIVVELDRLISERRALNNKIYRSCGGCGASEPRERCIGCGHVF